MSDLECYLDHCYDLVLQKKPESDKGEGDAELCACANLIEHEDSKQPLQPQEIKHA